MLFEPAINYVAGAPSGFLANVIVIPDQVLIDDKQVHELDQIEQNARPGERRIVKSFRGRDLGASGLRSSR